MMFASFPAGSGADRKPTVWNGELMTQKDLASSSGLFAAAFLAVTAFGAFEAPRPFFSRCFPAGGTQSGMGSSP